MSYEKVKELDTTRTLYKTEAGHVCVRIVQATQDVDGDDIPDFVCIKSSGCVCDEDGNSRTNRVPEKVRSISLSALSEGTLTIESELDDVTNETIERVLKIKAAHEALSIIPSEEN